MHEKTHSKLRQYIAARRENPAWIILASPIAPSIISGLQELFSEASHDGIEIDKGIVILAKTLQEHDENELIDVPDSDFSRLARHELKAWTKRGLISDRGGKLFATDALQKVLRFVDGLDSNIMTSTASRLATVQQAITSLDTQLNPNPEARIASLERRIEDLQFELEQAKQGHFVTIKDADAIEQIQEVYQLASSLRADFRRVEDSYREADKKLRHSIINDDQHRGDVLDKLLDGHDALLKTPEGRVFYTFHQQLSHQLELDEMSQRIKTILMHKEANNALNPQQQQDLKWLKTTLVDESESVIRARSRSERDVKTFIKSGLAAEQHKVGQVLKHIFSTALDIDWSKQSTRREISPLPPIAISMAHIPVIERLKIKSIDNEAFNPLNFENEEIDLNDIDNEFWSAFDHLNRETLINDTLSYISEQPHDVSVKELSEHFNPEHDLESIALWMNMASELQLFNSNNTQTESFTLEKDDTKIVYTVPSVKFSAQHINQLETESFGE